MGTFVDCIDKSRGIPKEKQNELRKRMKKLFQEGGMMDVQEQRIFDRTIYTISPVEYDQNNCIDFIYNYFEDTTWENAGFNGNSCEVYSGKVGWSYFHFVVSSAYVLQGLYSDGDFVTIENNEPFINAETHFISWINDLFDEHYSWKNWDIIKAYDLLNDENVEFEKRRYLTTEYGYNPFISYFEMLAVRYGIDEMKEHIEEDSEKINQVLYLSLKNKEAVKHFKEERNEDESKQINILIDIINQFMNNEDFHMKGKEQNKHLSIFLSTLMCLNSPNIALQSISEVYKVNFWRLYHRLSHHKRIIISELNDAIYFVPPTHLSEFFDIYPENMIYFIKEDKNREIDPHLKQWFQELRNIYDQYAQETINIDNPIIWIIDMLAYAEENYYQIFVFTDFLKETFNNISNQKYLILWKIFEDMIYDETMYKNGGVIFKSEEKEYNSWDCSYRRCLKSPWFMIGKNKKWNTFRLKLRGYLALLANKELRKKVFGF